MENEVNEAVDFEIVFRDKQKSGGGSKRKVTDVPLEISTTTRSRQQIHKQTKYNQYSNQIFCFTLWSINFSTNSTT